MRNNKISNYKGHALITNCLLLLSLALFGGCVATFAPRYDEAVTSGLSADLRRGLTLLEEVADGTQPAEFAKREPSYNALLGSLEALKIQLLARAVPSNKYIAKANKLLAKRGLPVISDRVPSADAVEELLKTFREMRRVDKLSGIAKIQAAAFKNTVILSFDQAITYESFLKR